MTTTTSDSPYVRPRRRPLMVPDAALPARVGMSTRLCEAVNAQRAAYAEWLAADAAWSEATSDEAMAQAVQRDADDVAACAQRGDYSDPERSALAEQQAAGRAAARRATVALDRIQQATVTMVEAAGDDPAAPPAPAAVAKLTKLLDAMRALADELDAPADARRFGTDVVAAYGRDQSALHRPARVGPVAAALDALAAAVAATGGL